MLCTSAPIPFWKLKKMSESCWYSVIGRTSDLGSCFPGDVGADLDRLVISHVCFPLYVTCSTVGSSSDLCTCFVAQQSWTLRSSLLGLSKEESGMLGMARDGTCKS